MDISIKILKELTEEYNRPLELDANSDDDLVTVTGMPVTNRQMKACLRAMAALQKAFKTEATTKGEEDE